MTFNLENSPFVPTTRNFNGSDDQIRIMLNAYLTIVANAVNIREISQYDLIELINGQQFFDPTDAQKKRYSFRKVFEFDDSDLNFPHGITDITICTYIGGGAVTVAGNFIPIPYVSVVLANQIEIDVTPTNIIITKGAGAPVITDGIIILEYLKN
jgi:hypothetical protein